jgi:hypothetical protein
MLVIIQCRTFSLVCCQKNIKIKILPMVLYGCETCSLRIREEDRPRVFESRLLRRIFGPGRNGVMEGCRELHNEEIRDFYSSPS